MIKLTLVKIVMELTQAYLFHLDPTISIVSKKSFPHLDPMRILFKCPTKKDQKIESRAKNQHQQMITPTLFVFLQYSRQKYKTLEQH